MARPKIVLYFDMHSPFSYLAFEVIRTFPIFTSCDVTYVPILLVGLIQKIGVQPPWASKNKAEWIQRDRLLWARQFGIPMANSWPEKYPYTVTLSVQRAICACFLESPDMAIDATNALFKAFWVNGKAIQLPEIFQPILQDILGENLCQKVIEASSTSRVKDLLRKNTDQAVSAGACGLPWIVATDRTGQEEAFWGFDHLGQVVNFLGVGKLASSHL